MERDHSDGTDVSAPGFCFPDGLKFDPDDPHVGFMQSDLIAQVRTALRVVLCTNFDEAF